MQYSTLGIFHPDDQLQVDSTICKFLKMYDRFGVSQYLRPFFCGLQHDAQSQFNRTCVTDTKRQNQSYSPVRVSLADNRRSNEGVIGNKDFRSVVAPEHHISRGERSDFTLAIIDGDNITYMQRAIQKNDEAAYIVTCDFLQ